MPIVVPWTVLVICLDLLMFSPPRSFQATWLVVDFECWIGALLSTLVPRWIQDYVVRTESEKFEGIVRMASFLDFFAACGNLGGERKG